MTFQDQNSPVNNSNAYRKQESPLSRSVEIHPKPKRRYLDINLSDHADTSYKSYTLTEVLGEGTYGKVYKAVDPAGNAVALKTISLERENEGVPSTGIREVALLKELRHPNIIK